MVFEAMSAMVESWSLPTLTSASPMVIVRGATMMEPLGALGLCRRLHEVLVGKTQCRGVRGVRHSVGPSHGAFHHVEQLFLTQRQQVAQPGPVDVAPAFHQHRSAPSRGYLDAVTPTPCGHQGSQYRDEGVECGRVACAEPVDGLECGGPFEVVVGSVCPKPFPHPVAHRLLGRGDEAGKPVRVRLKVVKTAGRGVAGDVLTLLCGGGVPLAEPVEEDFGVGAHEVAEDLFVAVGVVVRGVSGAEGGQCGVELLEVEPQFVPEFRRLRAGTGQGHQLRLAVAAGRERFGR
ncbi:hypothetical protein R2F25_08655 [Streptomyces sp. UP1A-1]|nr:hypothetical protein [Streptomyces sp. UP1A-1]